MLMGENKRQVLETKRTVPDILLLGKKKKRVTLWPSVELLYTTNLTKPLNVQQMSLSTPGTEKSPLNLGGNP